MYERGIDFLLSPYIFIVVVVYLLLLWRLCIKISFVICGGCV